MGTKKHMGTFTYSDDGCGMLSRCVLLRRGIRLSAFWPFALVVIGCHPRSSTRCHGCELFSSSLAKINIISAGYTILSPRTCTYCFLESQTRILYPQTQNIYIHLPFFPVCVYVFLRRIPSQQTKNSARYRGS